MRSRARRREPGSLVPAAAALAIAYAGLGAAFRGPPERFWDRMTATGAALGAFSVAADRSRRRLRPRPVDALTGAAVAGALYGVFALGDRLARVVMPHGGRDIGAVYALRALRPAGELAARMGLVIGPAEELFWRGLLQGALAAELGPLAGAATAATLYGGAHVATGNATLVGAAAVAGAGWSALAAAGLSMPALIVSHALWDVWIFLVHPTEPIRPA